MNRLMPFLAMSLTIASCAAGAVVTDSGAGGTDSGKAPDGAEADATGDGVSVDAISDATVDGPDGALCPTVRPTSGSPCGSPGLHCESVCFSPTPDYYFWTAECLRSLGVWSVRDHPCAPEFG